MYVAEKEEVTRGNTEDAGAHTQEGLPSCPAETSEHVVRL